jgi:hypothetical protein
LATAQIVTASENLERLTYRIDDCDDIQFVSDSWARFATANGAPELAEGVVGRSLWDFVSDMTTRQIYQDLIGRVRTGRTASFAYRCDAPERRRFMHMMLRPTGRRGVEFDSVTLRIEPRRPVAVAARTPDPAQRLLRVCSWCKRVDVHGAWQQIEAAVESLLVFAAAAPPALTHAICPDCHARMLAEIGG